MKIHSLMPARPNVRVWLSVMFAIGLAGCGGSSNGDDAPSAGPGNGNGDEGTLPADPNEGWADLQGTWQSACFTRDEVNQQITRDIEGALAEQTSVIYAENDSTCVGEPVHQFEISYQYEVGDTLTTTGGIQAREIDVEVVSDPANVVPPGAQHQYDIFHIDGQGQLFFARESAIDEENRPQQLEFEIPYTRLD